MNRAGVGCYHGYLFCIPNTSPVNSMYVTIPIAREKRNRDRRDNKFHHIKCTWDI